MRPSTGSGRSSTPELGAPSHNAATTHAQGPPALAQGQHTCRETQGAPGATQNAARPAVSAAAATVRRASQARASPASDWGAAEAAGQGPAVHTHRRPRAALGRLRRSTLPGRLALCHLPAPVLGPDPARARPPLCPRDRDSSASLLAGVRRGTWPRPCARGPATPRSKHWF